MDSLIVTSPQRFRDTIHIFGNPYIDLIIILVILEFFNIIHNITILIYHRIN
jgi:hypothetical protein